MADLKEVLAQAREELVELVAQAAPLHMLRAKLQEMIAPLESKLREVNQALKAIEQPRRTDLEAMVRTLETATSAAMSRELHMKAEIGEFGPTGPEE